jgi:dolichol-phosphate mannosyltransferase
MRRLVGVQLPPSGADFFLVDRKVLEAFLQFNENNVGVHAIMSSLGFRQGYIEYVKEARLHGVSGWTFAKKLKLVIDSVTGFTYAPIRAMVYCGFFIALLGFLYGSLIVWRSIEDPQGSPVQGWSSTMVVILFLGGVQMGMLGILGEYVWRALDESRARPRFFVEDRTPELPPT